jgi:O-acetylhomoserine (thiol)-lyase
LSANPAVRWVSYPGLPGDRYHNLSREYHSSGAGPMVSFALDEEMAAAFLSRLRLLSTAQAAGGTRSAIRRTEKTAGAAAVFRLFVGIEDRDDLVADLEQAFAA